MRTILFHYYKAGGLAVNGKLNLLDVQPTKLHDRSPVFMGSKLDVEDFMSYMKL